ncbi:MAG: DUF2057 family protein [Oleiphilaceae bacterium]|nr:DUF2057 family protein [Oleiphilaceae bacterium]
MTQWFKLASAIAVVVLVSACSGNKVVPTYDGPKLAVDQQAILTAGENITVISVNGQRVPKYLLSNIEVNYGLKPGSNSVVFQYRSVWARHNYGEDGPRAQEVSSAPQQVIVDVKAGDRLRFDYAKASNYREAQQLASNFEASVVNERGDILANSHAPLPKVKESVVAAAINEPATTGGDGAAALTVASVVVPATAATPASGGDNRLPALDGLKVLWERASAEEKKAFLKWAFK